MTDFEKAVYRARAGMDSSKVMLAKWEEDFQVNPLYALSNADPVFEVAAENEVYTTVFMWLWYFRGKLHTENKGFIRVQIEEVCHREYENAIKAACKVSGSTSSSSNAKDRALAQAWLILVFEDGFNNWVR